MAKKVNKPTTITSREELENALGDYAKVVIQHDKRMLKLESVINLLRKKYEAELTELKEQAEGMFEDIQAWATLNQAAFETKKSLDLIHGIIGFRTCPAAVKQVGGVKVEHSIDMMQANPNYEPYLRTKTEIDKDSILGAYGLKKEGLLADLAAVGLKIEQKENFFVELKKEGGE
jgi:phage host-nuclease inhibitor protein Gam